LITNISLTRNQKGQSAVEFVLIAPLLFFIFFAIIQMAYMAYASLAVQRATLTIVKEAARSRGILPYDPEFQLLYSLAPLGALNKETLVTVLATECSVQFNQAKVHVQVRYPMPIWVPMIGKVFGQPLSPASASNIPILKMAGAIFKMLGKSPPELSFSGAKPFYVRWITFSADTIDENSF
jgi:hypothetical protein